MKIQIDAAQFEEKTSEMKANQIGAAMIIYTHEKLNSVVYEERLRMALVGSPQFWKSNSEEVFGLCDWLHQHAA